MMNAADRTLPSATSQIVRQVYPARQPVPAEQPQPQERGFQEEAASPSMASGAPKMLPTSRE